jgi:hypothetical protein
MINHLEEKPLENIKVVCKYPDVFPEELPGMPPDRDIEFSIELVPGTAPISKRPNRRITRKRFHSPKFIPLGSPSAICEQEGWFEENVC